MSLVTKDDLHGEVRGFPLIVVLAMQREQYLQGNEINFSPFIVDRLSAFNQGGFTWENTNLGQARWEGIILRKHFNTFFNNINLL